MTTTAVVVIVALTFALASTLVLLRSRSVAFRSQLATARSDLKAVTEQRDAVRADAVLRERILSSMEAGVILAAGRDVVYANPAAASLLGEAPRSLPAWIVVPIGDEPVTSVVSVHHPRRRELRCVTAAPSAGAVLAVLQDVTEEARLEGARRDLVANASHEMKTPVAAILATAETLVTAIEEDPQVARRFAGTLVAEARNLATLLQNLLDLARLDRPVQPPEPVALADVVREQVAGAEPRAREAQVTLHMEIAPDVTVKGSADDLALLARNLLDNAVRYTPAGGSVWVQLEADDRGVQLRVRDTGIGIPSRDVPRIFERFYRVDRARSRETGGTGLGLAIVRAVAEAHGAEVTADSELGAGSTFTVRFAV